MIMLCYTIYIYMIITIWYIQKSIIFSICIFIIYVTYIHIHIYLSIGKTSILLRYTKGEYSDRQVSTLQASYLDKRVMINTTTVQLSIWDTAGQERFHALGPICYILMLGPICYMH